MAIWYPIKDDARAMRRFHQKLTWGLEEELRELLPWLAQLLGQSQGSHTLEWLIKE